MVKSICKFCGKEIVKRGEIPGVFCNMECKAEWQRQQKPVTREWLYQKYVVEELSAVDISKIVGRNSKRVWEWLTDYGIKTRGRGYASTHQFKKGYTSYWTGKKHPPEFGERLRELRKQDGHVPYLQNGKHYAKGKRGAEIATWKGGITPERQSLYNSPEWKEIVKTIWHRDNATCQRCGLDHRIVNREEVQFAIHHIVSFADRSLRFNVDNLVLLCRKCHMFIHSKANVNKEFLKEGNDEGA